MPETVLVHLAPNRFTEGFYRIDGDLLVMTYRDGADVMIGDGEYARRITHSMKPGDNVKAIAGLLTKEIRKLMSPELVEGFNDPIEGRIHSNPIKMPENGIA